MISVKVKKLHLNAVLPQYMSIGAAGADVMACLDKPIALKPMERVAVPTGLAFEIPPGYEIQVRPRSGLSFKKGLTVVNAPGTIDSDYRGEVKVLLVHLGSEAIEISHGERIAQLILQKVEQISWEESTLLSDTERAAGGFGSTGERLS